MGAGHRVGPALGLKVFAGRSLVGEDGLGQVGGAHAHVLWIGACYVKYIIANEPGLSAIQLWPYDVSAHCLASGEFFGLGPTRNPPLCADRRGCDVMSQTFERSESAFDGGG